MHPLVLLPGMNCTADLWTGTGLGPALAPSLDHPDITEQVEALLAELPDRFVLVGLSLGAIVAMALTQAAPERVAGLCVMSTNAKEPSAAQHSGWQDWLDRIDRGESARDLQRSILGGLLSDEGRARADAVDRALEMGERTGEQRLQAQLRMQQTRRDLRPGLGGLTMPVLVIGGQQDVICPPSFHVEIASAVPNSRYVSTDGGHLLPLERPETVGSLISDWRGRHRI